MPWMLNCSTGQWVKGKSADTFAPIGPWLVTSDEVPDPQDLAMWLEVDGHRYQNGEPHLVSPFGLREKRALAKSAPRMVTRLRPFRARVLPLPGRYVNEYRSPGLTFL